MALCSVLLVAACGGPRQLVWRTDEGSPVPSNVIRTRIGPEHCDWETVLFLDMGSPIGAEFGRALETVEFVRSSDGAVSPHLLLDEFEANTSLPPDAEFAGYVMIDSEVGSHELWISEAELERAVYMVRESAVEKWPRAVRQILCA